MKQKLFWVYFIVLSFAATLFHFLYDFTAFPPFKIIAPINESVWEHSKILVIPFLIFAVIYYFVKKPQDKLQYLSAVAKASLIMQVCMIVIYYTYTGIIGRGYLACDILLTYICVFVGLLTFFSAQNKQSKYPRVWISLYAIQLFLIILFTFWQPPLALFLSAS